jgi:membrane-bound inhibitor of C-type lysozyme
MADTFFPGSDNSGSPKVEMVPKAELEAVTSKLGEQGNELGEYRQFFTNMGPLLDKLEANPALMQAIVDGKIDANIADAVVDGRFSIKEAEAATKAIIRDVEKKVDSGKVSSVDAKDLVAEGIAKLREELDLKSENDKFEKKTLDFINQTPDFSKHADAVYKWLDDHKTISDVDVAYYAVKGELTVKQAQARAEEESIENAKDIALNAGGGSSTARYAGNNQNIVDSLIAGKSNPNRFF